MSIPIRAPRTFEQQITPTNPAPVAGAHVTTFSSLIDRYLSPRAMFDFLRAAVRPGFVQGLFRNHPAADTSLASSSSTSALTAVGSGVLAMGTAALGMVTRRDRGRYFPPDSMELLNLQQTVGIIDELSRPQLKLLQSRLQEILNRGDTSEHILLLNNLREVAGEFGESEASLPTRLVTLLTNLDLRRHRVAIKTQLQNIFWLGEVIGNPSAQRLLRRLENNSPFSQTISRLRQNGLSSLTSASESLMALDSARERALDLAHLFDGRPREEYENFRQQMMEAWAGLSPEEQQVYIDRMNEPQWVPFQHLGREIPPSFTIPYIESAAPSILGAGSERPQEDVDTRDPEGPEGEGGPHGI